MAIDSRAITAITAVRRLTGMHVAPDFRGGVEMTLGEFYACTDWISERVPPAGPYMGTAALHGVITTPSDGRLMSIRTRLIGSLPIINDWQIMGRVAIAESGELAEFHPNPGICDEDVDAVHSIIHFACAHCGLTPRAALIARHAVVCNLAVYCIQCSHAISRRTDSFMQGVGGITADDLFSEFLPSLRTANGSTCTEWWPVEWVVATALTSLSAGISGLSDRVRRRLHAHDLPTDDDLYNAEHLMAELRWDSPSLECTGALNLRHASPAVLEALCWAVGEHARS